MKIGLVVDDGLDRLDGVQKFTVTIGEYYRSRGHDVHYLAGQTKRTDIKNIHSLSKNIKIIFNGGNQLSIPLPSAKANIKKILASEKFDILHVQTPYSPFMAGRIIKYAPKKTVIFGTFHILPYGHISNLGSYILGRLQQGTIKKFDKFFSVSKPAQVFAKKTFMIKSEIIPNPVDTTLFKTKSRKVPTKHVNIVYLNRLVKRKGCQQLLEAIYDIIENGRNDTPIKLHIISDGALRQKLEEYTSSHGLEDIVTFHGYVTDQQKIDLLQKADIAVFPSTSGESFGIVLIEAMAAGAGVVVAGDNPGYRSVLDDDEVLFDPNDITLFSSLLTNFINHPSHRKIKHAQQQKMIAKYDIQKVGDRLLDEYYICKTLKG